jgi:DNA-binding transcriptional regulator/RsmH inhibitor MraZ
LIHPLLRKSAEVIGDVAVMGYLTYLEVWELDKFKARMLADPIHGRRRSGDREAGNLVL